MRWSWRRRDWAWGADCAGGLSIGLSVDRSSTDVSTPVRWRWALRNRGEEPREVTVQYDLDRAFRCRLQVLAPGSGEVREEFVPALREPLTSVGRARNVRVEPGEVVEVDEDEAAVGARLGPGTHRLQVRFGGPDFTFDCTSGVVEVEVRP